MPHTFSSFTTPTTLHKPFLPHTSLQSFLCFSYLLLPFHCPQHSNPSDVLHPPYFSYSSHTLYHFILHTATPFYYYTPFYSPIDSPHPLTSVHLPLSHSRFLPSHTFILHSPYIPLGPAQFLAPTRFTSFTPFTHNPSSDSYSHACAQATPSNCLFPNVIWTPLCLESFLLYLRTSILPAPSWTCLWRREHSCLPFNFFIHGDSTSEPPGIGKDRSCCPVPWAQPGPERSQNLWCDFSALSPQLQIAFPWLFFQIYLEELGTKTHKCNISISRVGGRVL